MSKRFHGKKWLESIHKSLGTIVFKTVSPGRKTFHHQAWLRGEKSRWGLSELREVAGKPFPLWCVTQHSSGCPHREFPLVSQE